MNTFLPRLLLALAYPWLAHWAANGGGDFATVLALADLVLIVLVGGLLQRRPAAWLGLGLSIAVLAALYGSVWLRVSLLAPPVLFTGLVAWCFARSLSDPHGAVITRIVAALDRCEPAQLPPRLLRYTRRLSLAWAGVLALLCAANGVLALIAVPDGALARLGVVSPLTVTRTQWSLFANLLNYGLVGGFFVGEFALRRRWFPDRPYRNFPEFLRMLARLGPGFWRGLFSRG